MDPEVSLWACRMACGTPSLWGESEGYGFSGPAVPATRNLDWCRASPSRTVELLQSLTVILGQAVLARVAHWALVEGPHDGVRGRRVTKA